MDRRCECSVSVLFHDGDEPCDDLRIRECADVYAAGSTAWERAVQGQRVGRYQFLVGPAEVSVEDLSVDRPTSKRVPLGLLPSYPVRAKNVSIELFFQSPVSSVARFLRLLDGKNRQIALHTGEF
jgi:hypothetical protein